MRVNFGLLESPYYGRPTKKYSWPSINKVQNPVKEAILNAVESTNLQGKDRIIIPRALLKSAEVSSRLLFDKTISDLTPKEWGMLVEDALSHINPEDLKTKAFLKSLLSYLR